MILMGGGLGIVTGPVTDSVMSSVPRLEVGAGSAVNDTTREIGGALGIAILGSVLFGKYRDIVSAKLDSYGPLANNFLSARQRDLIENSPISVLEILNRPGLPGVVTDLDNPNSLVRVMQDATMQGWKYAAMIMVASVLATAIVFAVFMPWSRGESLIDNTGDRDAHGEEAAAPGRPDAGDVQRSYSCPAVW
jgi:hypothetical protein